LIQLFGIEVLDASEKVIGTAPPTHQAHKKANETQRNITKSKENPQTYQHIKQHDQIRNNSKNDIFKKFNFGV
jgi:hypothetical protein